MITLDEKRNEEIPLYPTVNTCRMCAPLGAGIAVKGIENSISLIHGSQGCSTYIRRYMIGHFREPVDIASSSLTEKSAIFGGESNLYAALDNIIAQYKPAFIGIISSCLAETIGEDAERLVSNYLNRNKKLKTRIIAISAPSYTGSHMDGFNKTVYGIIKKSAAAKRKTKKINIFSGFASCADIRHVREIAESFGADHTVFPDYSDTLDSGSKGIYEFIPEGGTKLTDITGTADAEATIELGMSLKPEISPGNYLKDAFGVKLYRLNPPIGIGETDKFFEAISGITGVKIPEKYIKERGRLVDAYIDAHKHLFDIKACIYGEEDFIVSMTLFMLEIGVTPSIIAVYGKGTYIRSIIDGLDDDMKKRIKLLVSADYEKIGEEVSRNKPDIMIGNSKGYQISRKADIPLIRTGFPVHDRTGGQRILHFGYRGAQELFDRIVNEIIAAKQKSSPYGYAYM